MTYISAIELENFQSIEKRTRIELRPIPLLHGPNSSGKSAIFYAIELLRILLDPVAVDEKLAADMVDRWARRGPQQFRTMFIAVEFPFEYIEANSVWSEPSNWKGAPKHSSSPSFLDIELEYQAEIGHPVEGNTVRIELTLGVMEGPRGNVCHLVESIWNIGLSPVLRIAPIESTVDDEDDVHQEGADTQEGLAAIFDSHFHRVNDGPFEASGST
jgi:hypothetical protein